MAIYSASGHKEVLDAILAENTFEYPLTVDNTRITKVVPNAKDPSKVRVTVDGIYDSGMYGFTSVNINRVDVAKLVAGVNPVIKSNNDKAVMVSEVLPAIAEQFGIDIPKELIVDSKLTLHAVSGDRPLYGGTLTVGPNHPYLYGSFDFSVDGIILDINRLIKNVELTCLVDTLPHHQDRYTGCTLIYANDYTAVANELSKIPLSTVNQTDGKLLKIIADAIGSVDGIPWIYSNRVADFNLYSSYVTKHCRTVDFDSKFFGVNTDYTHVIMIWTTWSICKNISTNQDYGLLIHYDRLEGRE